MIRANIEAQAAEYEKLLKTLTEQKARLKMQRKMQLTKNDIVNFIEEMLKGNPNEKDYHRQLINVLIRQIVVWDNDKIKMLCLFNFTDNDSEIVINPELMQQTLSIFEYESNLNADATCVQASSPNLYQRQPAENISFPPVVFFKAPFHNCQYINSFL